MLGAMGVLSVAGSVLLGGLSDRLGRRDPLALAYLLRGLGLAAWLAAPVSGSLVPLYIGLVGVGLSWGATASLTTASCADVWGARSAGAIAGLALLVMWLAHAVGTHAPALAVSYFGSYVPAVFVNQAVALAAAVVVFTSHEPALCRVGTRVGTPR
jgi:MFS family permease